MSSGRYQATAASRSSGYRCRAANGLELTDREPIDIIACLNRIGVQELRDDFKGEAMAQCPSDEAKPGDVLLPVGEVIPSAAPPRGRLKQATVEIEPYVFDAHARGSSQFGKSERRRSHLHSYAQTQTQPCPNRAGAPSGGGSLSLRGTTVAGSESDSQLSRDEVRTAYSPSSVRVWISCLTKPPPLPTVKPDPAEQRYDAGVPQQGRGKQNQAGHPEGQKK